MADRNAPYRTLLRAVFIKSFKVTNREAKKLSIPISSSLNK